MYRFRRWRRRLVAKTLRMPGPLFSVDYDELRPELGRL